MMLDFALNKEELRLKGDRLDAKLRKATVESHALSNTLKVVRHCNHMQRLGQDAKPSGSFVYRSFSLRRVWADPGPASTTIHVRYN